MHVFITYVCTSIHLSYLSCILYLTSKFIVHVYYTHLLTSQIFLDWVRRSTSSVSSSDQQSSTALLRGHGLYALGDIITHLHSLFTTSSLDEMGQNYDRLFGIIELMLISQSSYDDSDLVYIQLQRAIRLLSISI